MLWYVLQEAEMSPELLNLHQAISELQIAEDIMLDNYKQTFADFASFADKGNKILESADSVTYDQEGKMVFSIYIFILLLSESLYSYV